jgi:hypothetical protein
MSPHLPVTADEIAQAAIAPAIRATVARRKTLSCSGRSWRKSTLQLTP